MLIDVYNCWCCGLQVVFTANVYSLHVRSRPQPGNAQGMNWRQDTHQHPHNQSRIYSQNLETLHLKDLRVALQHPPLRPQPHQVQAQDRQNEQLSQPRLQEDDQAKKGPLQLLSLESPVKAHVRFIRVSHLLQQRSPPSQNINQRRRHRLGEDGGEAFCLLLLQQLVRHKPPSRR